MLMQTGASRFPVKNFLTFLAMLICCGVTFGSFVHSFPGSLHTKYIFLLQPVLGSSFGTTGGGLKFGFGGTSSSFEKQHYISQSINQSINQSSN